MPPLEERTEYPYQNIRVKNFPFGDGDKVSLAPELLGSAMLFLLTELLLDYLVSFALAFPGSRSDISSARRFTIFER